MGTRTPSNKSRFGEDSAIVVSVDGARYTLRPSDLTAKDAQLLRKATGLSLRAVMAAATDDPDIDVVAAIVWLARLRREPGLAYDQVATEIGYDSEISAEDPAAAEEGEGPEA